MKQLIDWWKINAIIIIKSLKCQIFADLRLLNVKIFFFFTIQFEYIWGFLTASPLSIP